MVKPISVQQAREAVLQREQETEDGFMMYVIERLGKFGKRTFEVPCPFSFPEFKARRKKPDLALEWVKNKLQVFLDDPSLGWKSILVKRIEDTRMWGDTFDVTFVEQ